MTKVFKMKELAYENFAVVFVHPFWLLREVSPNSQEQKLLDEERNNRTYGYYENYIRNLRAAYDVVAERGLRSAFIIPFSKSAFIIPPGKINQVLRPWPAKEELSPLEEGMIFEWSPYNSLIGPPTSGWKYNHIIHNGAYSVNAVLSGVDDMRDILAKEGIKTVAVCGEMGPYDKSLEGCVGVVAKSFRKEMKVLGLKECIFPLNPWEPQFIKFVNSPDVQKLAKKPALKRGFESNEKEVREVTKMLYETTITVSDLKIVRPQVFYKEHLCKTLTGHTDKELRDVISKKYVQPLAYAGDEYPRNDSEKLLDGLGLFMSTKFSIPLLDTSSEKIYEAFRKFKTWEEYVHPRDQFPHHETYWGPTYREIANTYHKNDIPRFKAEIARLIDQILHD